MTSQTSRRIFTVKQVADHVGVHTHAIILAEKEGRIPAARDRELQQSLSDQVTARSGGTARSSGGTVRSSGGTANGATAEDNTQSAIDDMFNTFATRREAEAALSDPAMIRELQAHGVDIAAVIEAAQGLGERRIGSSDY